MIDKGKREKIVELIKTGISQDTIAEQVGVAQSSVARIRKQENLRTCRWTEEEIEYLKESYGTYSWERISKKIGRSVGGIKKKAIDLNLGSTIEASEYLTLAELGRIFGRNRSTIKAVWVDGHGLKVKRKVLSKQRKFYQVSIEELWKWAKNNRELIDFSRVEEGALGVEPEWVREQRRRDIKRIDKKKHLKWEEREDEILKLYWLNKTAREIGEIIGRSEDGVRVRAKKLGLKPKVVELKWTDIEVDMLIDMKSKGHTDAYIAEEIGRSVITIRWKRAQLIKKGLMDWEYRSQRA